MILFDKCDVKINGTGIIAESASIDESVQLQFIEAVGYRGNLGPSSNGPRISTIQIDYFIETRNEPNYKIVSGLKRNQNTFHYEPISVVVNSITGSGYLENYLIRTTQDDLARASATFICFVPLSGNLTETRWTGVVNRDGVSGLAHGWNTKMYLPDNSTATDNFYSFGYEFKANWDPIYVVGAQRPAQVQLAQINETVSLNSDFYRPIFNSGIDGETQVRFHRIELGNVSGVYYANIEPLCFYISGFSLQNQRINAQVNQFLNTDLVLSNIF